MKEKNVKLGITGGIGSGKSFFSAKLQLRGIPVFDSDSEAKRLMLSDKHIVSSITDLLGEGVYVDGRINKQLLASFIFASSENALKVNNIVHPCVKTAFLKWADEKFSQGYKTVAIESAILFESGFNSIVDKVVTVSAPLEVRIARVMQRDNCNREKVIERINSQMDDEKKRLMSDFVIENDGIVSIDMQIDNLISEL